MVRERLQHNHLDLIHSAAVQAVGAEVEIRLDVDEALRGPIDDVFTIPDATADAIAPSRRHAPARPRTSRRPTA